MRKLLVLAMTLVALPSAYAGPSITLQGRIADHRDAPLTGLIQFRVQLLGGPQDCILFDEMQMKDLTDKAGLYTISLNDGSAGSSRNDTNPWSLQDALSNRITYSVAASACSSGSGTITYTPGPSDERRVRVMFKDATTTGWDMLPIASLTHSPRSLDSVQVGGFAATNLCRVENAGVPQSVASMTSTAYNELLALGSGSSTTYAKLNGSNFSPTSAMNFNSQRLTNLSDPTATTDAATKNYADTKLGSKAIDASSFATLTTTDAGKILVWNGSAWAAQAAAAQTFAITATAPLQASSGAIPNLSIAKSSASADGYLAATDFAVFAAKQSKTLSSAHIWIGNGSSVATEALVSGDVTMTNAGATTVVKLRGTSLSSTTPQAGQLLKFDGSEWSPVQFGIGDLRTTTGATQFANASCTASQTLTWSSLTDTFSCTNISVADSAVSYSARSANLILGSPVAATGTPVFRSLATSDLPDQGVTFSKIQNLSGPSKLLGRSTSGAGSAEELSVGTGLSISSGSLINASPSQWGSQVGGINYAGGKVGIGTTSPSEALDVAGNVNVTGSIVSSGNQLIIQQSGDLYGATRLRLQNRDGLNGAAFENPTIDLVDFAFIPSSNVRKTIRYEHRPGYVASPFNSSSGEFQYTHNSGAPTDAWFASGPSATIIQSGRVGIGTVAPEVALDVNGLVRMRANSSVPLTCSSSIAGTIALTSTYVTCACNGSAWVKTSDGVTACSW